MGDDEEYYVILSDDDDDEELKSKKSQDDNHEETETRLGGTKLIFKSKDLRTNKSLRKATKLAMEDLKSNNNDKRFVLKRLITATYVRLGHDYFNLDLELEDELGKSYLYRVHLSHQFSSVRVEITGKLIPEFVQPNVDDLMLRVSHDLVKPADTKKNCLLSLFKKSSRAGQFPKTIVHAEKKTECSEIAKALVALNLRVVACCGERESEAVNDFRRGLADILVVHGSASRGLDVDPVAVHVVNLNLPKKMKDYVSRIGWTTCRNRSRVTSFYTDRDKALVAEIKKAIVDAESGKGKVKEIAAQGDTTT